MKKTILIIDDEPEYCEMLRMRLEAHDFTVVTALDGTEGLKQARSSPPDLILLDVMLPGADGGDIARSIHSDPGLSAVPVIFLTAAITEAESHGRWNDGSERILAKTMDPNTLVQKLRDTLAEGQG
jgi:DNA-binding response OmpR family regulator